jgi:hypothetical protein
MRLTGLGQGSHCLGPCGFRDIGRHSSGWKVHTPCTSPCILMQGIERKKTMVAKVKISQVLSHTGFNLI